MPIENLITNTITLTNITELTNNLTNWVTQTNAVSAPNDPQLLVTGLGAVISLAAIIVSGILIYRQVAIMKEQSKISKKQLEISKLHITEAKINELMSIFIDINRQYNESLFHICKLRNNPNPNAPTPAIIIYDPHPEGVVPYYFNLSLFLNLACKIYYQQESNIRSKITENFKNIFDEDIIQFFKRDVGFWVSEYDKLKNEIDPINIKNLIQYHHQLQKGRPQ